VGCDMNIMRKAAVFSFIGEFEKLRKATISYIMSVLPSARPPSTTRLPLGGFS